MDRGQILFHIGMLGDRDLLVCTFRHNIPCLLQLAFTMVWMTIVSQLGYYKLLYGPQVLLQMNIAYFLPSIPLLGLSSFYDEKLDQQFGTVTSCYFGSGLLGQPCLYYDTAEATILNMQEWQKQFLPDCLLAWVDVHWCLQPFRLNQYISGIHLSSILLLVPFLALLCWGYCLYIAQACKSKASPTGMQMAAGFCCCPGPHARYSI